MDEPTPAHETAVPDDRATSQALALAAAMQGVHCVRRIATEGEVDTVHIRPLIESLLRDYDGSIPALYGGAENLTMGLRRLVEQLEAPKSLEATRYLATLLQVERRVMKRRDRLGEIVDGLGRVRQQAEYFGDPMHSSVLGGLAELYSRTVSEIGPRILVQGNRAFLEDEQNAATLRAILFGCVRAATLWREHGGGRLQLIFGRRRIARTARDLLRRLPESADTAMTDEDSPRE